MNVGEVRKITLEEWVTNEHCRGTSDVDIRRVASPWSDLTGEDEVLVLAEIERILEGLR